MPLSVRGSLGLLILIRESAGLQGALEGLAQSLLQLSLEGVGRHPALLEAALDNQKPSWAPEKMERKATRGKERAFVHTRKGLFPPQKPTSEVYWPKSGTWRRRGRCQLLRVLYSELRILYLCPSCFYSQVSY